jgi:hypothetical protein
VHYDVALTVKPPECALEDSTNVIQPSVGFARMSVIRWADAASLGFTVTNVPDRKASAVSLPGKSKCVFHG